MSTDPSRKKRSPIALRHRGKAETREKAAAFIKKTVARRAARQKNVLHVGIASYEEVKARTLAIARGELKPKPGDPKVWFPSTETFGKVLSGKNRELLAEIRRAEPGSLQELAVLTGRKVPNLSRTLKTMERYGLVRLNKGADGRIAPEVPYDDVDVKIALVPEAHV